MIITRTPMRISFTGGGTDIRDFYQVNGGAVVSMAIDKYVYITVNTKFDRSIRVSYSKTEIVNTLDEVQHELVRECMKRTGVTDGVEITSIADIPSGTGLGSSSAFTVGVLNALYSYRGERLSSVQLAEAACDIEINVLKHPIGKQDQYAAANGGLNCIRFFPDETVRMDKILLSEDDMRKMRRKLMLFYTGITRSADVILQEQKKNTAQKMDSLRFMKEQALEMYSGLTAGGFTADFARALHRGWEKKRELAGTITNAEINRLYDKAMAAGASGGKLLGAGGGGFLLFYCDEVYQQDVRDAIGLRQMDFAPDTYGSKVIFFA